MFCAVVGVTFAAATMATGVQEGFGRRTLPDRFAHSMVLIIVGYIVAHYLGYFVEVGQQTVVQRSGTRSVKGWNLLGTALRWTVSYWLSNAPDVPGDPQGAVGGDLGTCWV